MFGEANASTARRTFKKVCGYHRRRRRQKSNCTHTGYFEDRFTSAANQNLTQESSGTIKGIVMFTLATHVLKTGGHVLQENKGHLYNNTSKTMDEAIAEIELDRFTIGDESI